MTPRQLTRDHILTALREIKTGNGYSMNIETVELRKRTLRQFNASELPAVVMTPKLDVQVRPETLGGNLGNKHMRAWTMELMLLLVDGGNWEELDDAAEEFIACVSKTLIANRTSTDCKPFNIAIDSIQVSDFERVENDFMQVAVTINAFYEFTRGNL